MKSLVHLLILCTVFSSVISCQSEDKLTKSRIIIPQDSSKPIDVYIRRNFITPYNIDIKYNSDIQYSNNPNVFMMPASEQKIRYILDFYKDVWIKSFNEAGGSDFIKDSGISRITLFGSDFKIPPNGEGQAADARGGIAIRVYGVNYFELWSPIAYENHSLITILHEYTHILDQVKPKDIKFRNITPKSYSYAEAPLFLNSLESGYITAYAGSNETEDFAEMSSHMLVMTKKQWEDKIDDIPNGRIKKVSEEEKKMSTYKDQLSKATNEAEKKRIEGRLKKTRDELYNNNKALDNIKEAQDKLREKASYVIAYYRDNYGIDFEELRAAVLKNFKEFYEKHKK